ncbi:MAG: hypothetical protein FD152_3180 [Xanthobacteraceae bacterium]|nr:MAG: hypothetical protein FD152_3180 [Xanthobacteraceae bacterium]
MPGPFARFCAALVHDLAALVSLSLFVGAVIVAGSALTP